LKRIQSRVSAIDARIETLERGPQGAGAEGIAAGQIPDALARLRDEKRALGEQTAHLDALLQGHARPPARPPRRWTQTALAIAASLLVAAVWQVVFRASAPRTPLFDEDGLLVLLGFAVALAAYFAQVNQTTKQAAAREGDIGKRVSHVRNVWWVTLVEHLDVIFGLLVAHRLIAPYLPPTWPLRGPSMPESDVLLLLFLVAVVAASALLHVRQAVLWWRDAS
jgi:hypothetical protein